MAIADYIHDHIAQRRRMLAVLIDPEKTNSPAELEALCRLLNDGRPDFIFVGGSTGHQSDEVVRLLKQHTDISVVLFPGNIRQFTPAADALLVLSLLSSRNPDFLIGLQVKAARRIAESHIDTLSVGYILVDGGKRSSIEHATCSEPLAKTDDIIDTAIAAQLLGFQSIYLEAGSGAKTPVFAHDIRLVRQHVHLPLIVGGGIRSVEQMLAAYRSGADIIVIGNHFESHPEQIPLFCHARND